MVSVRPSIAYTFFISRHIFHQIFLISSNFRFIFVCKVTAWFSLFHLVKWSYQISGYSVPLFLSFSGILSDRGIKSMRCYTTNSFFIKRIWLLLRVVISFMSEMHYEAHDAIHAFDPWLYCQVAHRMKGISSWICATQYHIHFHSRLGGLY